MGQFEDNEQRPIPASTNVNANANIDEPPQLPVAKWPTTTMLALEAYGTDEEEVAKGIGRRIRSNDDQKGGQKTETTTDGGPEELLESSMTPHLPSTSTAAVAINQKSKTPKSGKKKNSIEQILPTQMDELVSLDQFYVNLNTMEEYMDQQQQKESLPFEGLDEKADILNVSFCGIFKGIWHDMKMKRLY